MRTTLILVLFSILMVPSAVLAQPDKGCNAMDRACLTKSLEQIAPDISNAEQRDLVYRKIARTLTLDGQPDKALALLPLVTGNEQKALMMGDIGKAAAEAGFSANQRKAVFQKLLDEAKASKHDKTQATAFAEIGVAQALSGDITGAKGTLGILSAGAQRDKALAWAGAMRAKKGDVSGAVDLLAAIASQSYRNKALGAVSNVFLEKAQITEAYACASRIDNAYLKAEVIQRILDKGNADKIGMAPHDDLAKILDQTP